MTHSAESYGAAWGDLNDDNWPDLFVNNHRARPNLFLNRGDGTFADVAIGADTSGLWASFPQSDQHGGAWADFDNDGDQDLIVPTGQGYPNQFFVNDGGLLTDKADAAGLNNWDQSYRSPLWVDWNNDGLLDLILSNFHGDFQAFDQEAGVFMPKPMETGLACRQGQFAAIGSVVGSRLELLCHGEQTVPSTTHDLTTLPFLDISAQIQGVLSGRDMAIADFDGDGLFDLFFPRGRAERMSEITLLANGTIGGQILINAGQQKSFSFDGATQVTFNLQEPTAVDLTKIRIGDSGINPTTLPFTLSADDPSVWGLKSFDPNLNRGVYIGYDVAAGRWQVVQSGGSTSRSTSYVVSGDGPLTNLTTAGLAQDEWYVRPVLLRNGAGGLYDDSSAAGFNELLGCISSIAGDFDNDMDVDLYLVCRGGISNLPNVLYWNNGDGTFTKDTNAAGAAGSVLGVGENVAYADYDADGFLDLFVTNGLNLVPPYTAGPLQLFRNQGNGNHWVQFDLVGVASNRDGIGAKVTATAGGVSQVRFQDGGVHRWAQNHKRLHFGLAANTTVDLVIEWPSGHVDTITGVAADATYRIEEGLGATPVQFPTVTVPSYPMNAWGSYDYNAVTDTGVFVWKGYDGTWHLRAVGDASHAGTVLSASGFTSVVPVSLESGDLVDSTTDPNQIVFGLSTTAGYEDGFDFTVIPGTQPCLQLSNNGIAHIGAGRHALVTPLDLETLEPCSDQEATPTPSYFLGQPSYDPGTEQGVFLWLDSSGTWHLRFTAGGGSAVYQGDLVSSEPFTGVLPYSIEANDVLDTSDANRIHFKLTMGGAYQDGFDFTFPAGTHVCLSVDTPAGTSAIIGATRYVAPLPLDLATGGACGGSDQPGISIDDLAVGEAAGTATFTVTLTGASTDTVSVDFTTIDGSAVQGLDYLAASGILTFQPGEVSKTIDVALLDDTLAEGDEAFSVALANLVNAVPVDLTGVGTILDDEASPCGAPTYDPATTAALYAWKDCATGTWTVRTTAGGGSVTYVGDVESDQPFTSVTPFSVESNDVFDTSNPYAVHFEFKVGSIYQDGFSFAYPAGAHVCFGLDAPAGANALLGAAATPTTLPVDLATGGACSAPSQPGIAVTDVTAGETAGVADFVVSLSEASDQVVTVDYTSVSGTATADVDYTSVAGTLSFNAGETSKVVGVPILDDDLGEGDETFTLELSTPVGAYLLDASGTGTITDDEISPCGAPSYDGSIDRAVFLWKDCTTGAWRMLATAGGGQATYQGSVVSDQPFLTVEPFSVESNDLLDYTSDPRRIDYGLTMSGQWDDGFGFTYPADAHVCFGVDAPADATVLVGSGRLPVTSPFDLATLGPCNGVPVQVSVADVIVAENDAEAVFTLSLSEAATEAVSVDVATVDDTAIAGADYTAVAATVTFVAGDTGKTIAIPILDDTLAEGEERFRLALSNPVGLVLATTEAIGTIMDDEISPCGAPTYNGGVDAAVFLWKDCTTGVWHTRMTAGGGTVTYMGDVVADQPFTSITPFSIEANDLFDTTVPGVITYGLTTSSTYQDGFDFSYPAGANVCFGVDAPAGALILMGAARTLVSAPLDLATLGGCGTPPTIAVDDVTVDEGAGVANFTVTLSAASTQTVTVDVQTADGTATAPDDYTALAPTTVTFAPGETAKTVGVTIVDDALVEGDESFTVQLSNAVNGEIGAPSGLATIVDNDSTS